MVATQVLIFISMLIQFKLYCQNELDVMLVSVCWNSPCCSMEVVGYRQAL